MDAIHCLAMTQSNFSGSDQVLMREGSDFYRLEGRLIKGNEAVKLVLKSGKRIKKMVERNNLPCDRLADHIGFVPMVMVAPNDIDLIDGGNAVRRKMFDKTLSQVSSSYLEHGIQYGRLLKQRNALLKQFQEGKPYDDTLLTVYDQRMSPHALAIYQARRAFLSDYVPLLKRFHCALSNQKEDLGLDYQCQVEDDNYLELVHESRSRDRALGRSTTGPHTDKISFLINQKPAKLYASQGQKKSAIFASKMAQYIYLSTKTKELPVLLLDDVFDRLDHERVHRLLNEIVKDDFGQVFITDTKIDRLDEFFSRSDRAVKKIEIG